MNDPHVVALFYNIEHSASVVYREAEPREYEAANFSVRIENKKVCFTMKAHYATEEEARKAVEEYIQVWELDAALQRGPNAFTLEFSHLEIEDRKPTPAAPGELAIGMTAIAGEATVDIGLVVERRDSSYPPPPPSGMKITPDVRSMFARWAGYRLGKEPLASMASFCLTILEASVNPKRGRLINQERKPSAARKAAAKEYKIALDAQGLTPPMSVFARVPMCVQRSDMRLVWLKTRWLIQDHWKTLAIWGAGALLFLFATWASAEAARLENPGNDQFYSGIGAISGWKCDVSGPLTVRIDGGPAVPLVYGSDRLDTRQVCGDTNNGFVVLWNWALVGDGRHTAHVYDNGNLFAQATFEVGTLGTEFLRGFEGDSGLAWSGGDLSLRWNESTQHFEMLQLREHDKESREQYNERIGPYSAQLDRRPPAWHAPAAQLENPGDGQLYSGIGVISGWKCDVVGPLTIRFNGGQPVSLIYGSERADTKPACGDTDNGFVALWNWALVGDGIHTARAYDNGVAFAEITFQVGTAGGEWWSGTRCHPANLQTCWVWTFSEQLLITSKTGYDGWFWSDRPSGAGLWNTYFKWNASTQHFEVVARRQYQPFSPPEPPESWRWQERSFADRPDDLNGPQIHIYYAEPSDARGRYDKIGYISAAVQDAQRWLAARTDQGRAFRIDTYQGRPDVTTLPLDVTTAEMQAANLAETIFGTPLLPGGVSLTALGRRDPNKLHFVFIAAPPPLSEDSGRIACGVAAPWTGVAVMFSGRPFLPQHGNYYCGYETNIFLHEIFHLLGAIHPDAPHADGTGHVAYIPFGTSGTDEGSFDEDGNRLGRADSLPKRHDLMHPITGRESELDIGSDDYYFHPEKTPVWPPPHYDTVYSPFFTDGPWTDVTQTVAAHLQPSSRASLSPMGAVSDLPLPHELEAVEESWCPGPWLGTTIPPFRP